MRTFRLGGLAVLVCFSSIVVAAQSAPTAVSATPNSGTGATQVFTFVYSDADGYQDLWNTQVMLNTGTDTSTAAPPTTTSRIISFT